MKLNASCTTGRLILCILALTPALLAQQNKLSVAPSEPLIVKRGQPVKQVLKAAILPGFHVNSDKPRDEFLIPLKLTWDASPLQVGAISYPKPEEIELNGSKILVFTGTVPIETEFKPGKELPLGEMTLTGKLRYQACNDQMCFRPMTVDVKLKAIVE